ncbi:hypothetical protein [Aurantimonas sp. A2-1-M11]|uniref:hypothetical protein n=1 Tax=Aurantimonas sp. A2-1-M11 TaxID=3113712 RepID=UPI002F95F650
MALLIGLTLAFATPPAEARTKAAAWVVKEEIASACEGEQGTIDPAGVMERDLDGDGNSDLVLAHDAIYCSNSQFGRSSFCGMQVCSVNLYVRRDGLLKKVGEVLGGGVTIGEGRIPAISMHAHGGQQTSVKWDGKSFK